MADKDISTMSLPDWLDDLTVRFLLNLPESELSSVPRLCFQVEEAQWFYEDFIRPLAASANHPLPSLPLRQFCIQLFRHCPLLSGFTDAQHIAAYEEFLAYKVRVPVRGAILVDESLEKVVLVKGWKKGASWSFPRGKINKDEKDLDCAIREVYEETGFDVKGAGLVPEDEESVKFIDVTMREQHMRLFVFRGVPESTIFEPQTRKEISKIQWYNIRDLPGFKKHKGGQHAQEHASAANRFYMVAPFLGPLKKWINQQRRNDAVQDAQIAAPGMEMAHAHVDTAGEDTEGMTEQEQVVPEPTPFDQSAELKRLLSIGGSGPQSVVQPPPKPVAANGGQQTDLLALLRGAPQQSRPSVPQTPLEQINAFPPQPETPQPHHPRHPSMGYQQSVPQFPFSPQRLQERQISPQQRNFSVPTPNVFGHPSFPQGLVPHPHLQFFGQQQQQRASMPAPQIPGPQNGGPFSVPQRQPVQPPPQMPLQQQMPSHFPRPSDAFMAPQGPQGAIGGGPAVPKANALPMPKLNAHSLNLLNAFKAGEQKPAASDSATTQQPRQPSQHQAALLDLFRKPSASQASPVPTAEAPASPTLTDTTVKPSRPSTKDRRTTLNEITRTLPTKFKVKSPPANKPLSQPPVQPAVINTDAPAERPKSRGQLYNPANPQPSIRARPQQAQQPKQQTVPILQRPTSQHTARSPRPPRSPKAKGNENGAPQPQPAFTILPRPGSLRAAKSPAAELRTPSSPLRNEASQSADKTASAFQPQALKRPEIVDPEMVQKVAEAVEETSPPPGLGGQDKRDQLLALFGKSGISSPPPSSPAPAAAGKGADDRKNNLLDLFTAGPVTKTSSNQPTPTSATPTLPPPAPTIVPERKPSSQNVHQRQQTPQNALLDLFNKPSAPMLDSPGTPISPFTLGTPAQRHAPAPLGLHGHAPSHLAEQIRQDTSGGITPTPLGSAAQTPTLSGNATMDGQRSRIGSVVGAEVESANASRKGSGVGTPVEAKGFLLDFLRDVVRDEGHRGARRG